MIQCIMSTNYKTKLFSLWFFMLIPFFHSCLHVCLLLWDMCMFYVCTSTKGDHMKSNLGHKLHQVKSYETLKLRDFHIFVLDDDNSPIQKGCKAILHFLISYDITCLETFIIYPYLISPSPPLLLSLLLAEKW